MSSTEGGGGSRQWPTARGAANLRLALPGPLPGRHSREYRGRSVTLGLAPVGDRVIRPCCTYRARHRPPAHPLAHAHCTAERVWTATAFLACCLPPPFTSR